MNFTFAARGDEVTEVREKITTCQGNVTADGVKIQVAVRFGIFEDF